MRYRRLKIAALIVCGFVALYVTAFFMIVGAGHISTYSNGPGPQLPQFIMYVSPRSELVNKIAKYAFFPLIKCCEATGDFIYITDASDFGEELGPLAPRLWSILWD